MNNIGVCGNCNKGVQIGVSPCPYCGTVIDWGEMEQYEEPGKIYADCGNCGTRVSEDDEKCPNCGTTINWERFNEQIKEEENEYKSTLAELRRKREVRGGWGCIVFIFAVLFCWSFGNGFWSDLFLFVLVMGVYTWIIMAMERERAKAIVQQRQELQEIRRRHGLDD